MYLFLLENNMIDNDISRTLDYYAEKKVLVGRIKIADKDQIEKKSDKVVPIYMSENALKIINKSFMH